MTLKFERPLSPELFINRIKNMIKKIGITSYTLRFSIPPTCTNLAAVPLRQLEEINFL